MDNKIHILITFLCLGVLFSASGCETARKILGTSTTHLENARVDASIRAYNCSFDECFDAVLSLAKNEYAQEPLSGERYFTVFQKNRIKSFIVAMGIPGQVDTTEIGIFFIMLESRKIQIEVTSLSAAARQKTARVIFKELDMRFQPVR